MLIVAEIGKPTPDSLSSLRRRTAGELIVLEQLRTPCTALPELSRKTLVGAE